MMISFTQLIRGGKRRSSMFRMAIFLSIQFASGYAHACGQNPGLGQYSSDPSRVPYAETKPKQAPIQPITMRKSTERSAEEGSNEWKTAAGIAAGAAAAELPRRSSISGNGRSPFGDPIHAIGDKINELKGNLNEAAEEARTSISHAFRNAGQSAVAKLKESQLFLSDKFRPLADAAVQIFNKPGSSDKQRWDQLVQRVESTDLTDPDKREFYQKIVNATIQKGK